MKKAFLVLLISLSAPQIMAKSVSHETTQMDVFRDSVKSTCPTCEKVGMDVLSMLNKHCGVEVSIGNFKDIANSHPMFALLVASSTMLQNESDYQQFKQAANNSVDCNNPSQWVENTKLKVANRN